MKGIIKYFCAFFAVLILMLSFVGCEENVPVLPCTVTFDTNGGRSVDARTVKVVDKAPVTSKTGYVFAGWYLDQVMITPASFPLTVTEAMTLYAKWVKSVYEVSFDTNGGSYIAPLETDELSDVPIPTRNGYAFEGWYKDSTLNAPASFPMKVDRDITLYAKWLKTEDSQWCKNCQIKFMDSELDGALYFSLTPNGFDMNALATEGYWMTITVTYDVRYIKDYDVLWDVGYAGSPKYEISLMNSDGFGKHQNDLGTSKTADTRTISLRKSAAELINEKITLKFSTDNIQNIICFENIVVSYMCTR